MFEKTLQDLVKGIRSHKRDPSAFISQSIQEIKGELRTTDPFVKAQVSYLHTFVTIHHSHHVSWLRHRWGDA
jgi:AP-3 complex subunit delta